jgi:K+-transporting ATPase KdpF subunit
LPQFSIFADARGSNRALMVEDAALIVVCILLLGYLLVALLKPEKF